MQKKFALLFQVAFFFVKTDNGFSLFFHSLTILEKPNKRGFLNSISAEKKTKNKLWKIRGRRSVTNGVRTRNQILYFLLIIYIPWIHYPFTIFLARKFKFLKKCKKKMKWKLTFFNQFFMAVFVMKLEKLKVNNLVTLF